MTHQISDGTTHRVSRETRRNTSRRRWASALVPFLVMVGAVAASGAAAQAAPTATVATAADGTGSYIALDPVRRFLDTRQMGGPIGPALTRDLKVTGPCGHSPR